MLLPVSEKAKTWLPSFFVQCIIKQLLDAVFGGIQKNQGLGKG